jgi:tripartite-type tricarboxylate transporter receptor subunit TctC
LLFDIKVGPLPNIRAGKLKALAMTGKKRSPNLPEVPTIREIKELNLPNFEYESWNGVVVAANTPADIVQKLSQELARITALPDVREKLMAMGYDPRSELKEEFGAIIANDFKRFGQVIREVGMKLD